MNAAYYNEFDPFAAEWLRNLIKAGHIAPGFVDERSIEDVTADDLKEFTQCHFFAGIGVWSRALRRSGWDDSRPVWTGSCPCQPFSSAGAGAGFADPRHLWPAFAWLIEQCKPAIVFGEQVASKAVEPWVDLVHADLEIMGYAFGAVPFPAAGVGAPHIRDRLYWVANTGSSRLEGCNARALGNECQAVERSSPASGLADTESDRHKRPGELNESPGRDGFTHVCTASGPRPVNDFWRNADWLGCRDDKWRPVEPQSFPLVNGATARMVCVCPNCETETVIYEGMHSLRSVPNGNQGRGTEEVLRQGMLQAASFVAAAYQQKHRALSSQKCREESVLQPVPEQGFATSPPPGSECFERFSRESGENLLGMPPQRAFKGESEIDMRSVWNCVHRSLASQQEQDLFCPMCERVGPQKCFEEMGGQRSGRLRAYGNALCAEAATQFISAVMEV